MTTFSDLPADAEIVSPNPWSDLDGNGTTGYDWMHLVREAGINADASSGAGALLAANNLSDVVDPPSARSNLGLGTAATHATGDYDTAGAAAAAQAASQPVDSDLTAIAALTTTAYGRAFLALADAAAARTAAGLGTSATHASTDYALVANNLSDVTAASARTNLGLGTSATHASTDYALVANNLSDVTAASARTNLGLGTAATTAATAYTAVNATVGGDLTGTMPNPTLKNTGGGAAGPIGDGTHVSQVTVDAQGRVTGLASVAITASGADKLGLTPTAVKTANYTAAAGDLVPIDLATTGSFTLTFPTAPADGTIVAAKIVAISGSRTLTLTLGGSDVFNVAGGTQSGSLSLLNQAGIFQYKSSSAIWYTVATDAPLSQLDARYLTVAFGGTGAATLAAHGVVIGNGTTAVNVTSAGTTGQILTSNGASADPTFAALDISSAAGGPVVAFLARQYYK